MISAAATGSTYRGERRMKIEPDPVGSSLGASQRFVNARQTADLDADHGVRHARVFR